MGEAGERGEGRQGEVEFGGEGVVIKCFAETSQGFESQVGQGGVSPFGEDSERGRPGVDGARLQVGF